MAGRRFGVKSVMRVGIPVVVLAVCAHLISLQVTSELWHGLPAFAAQIPVWVWIGAVFLTSCSFLAVGRYDAIAHCHLRTGIPRHQAIGSGITAIAVAQTLGFGLFTGALARWRLLPGLSLPQAFGLSAFVSGSFVIAWAAITALACLILPAPGWTTWPAWIACLLLPGAALLLFRWPRAGLRGVSVRLPNLRATGLIVLWCCVDVLTAATALWLFLPAEAGLALTAFIPLYLIALGTALISNTPGGVGPFELMLLGALPHVPPDKLMQSIIAFRLVFYALPACVGMLVLLRSFPVRTEKTDTIPIDTGAHMAQRSEVGVIAQNGGYFAETQAGPVALWPTAQSLVALFAPVRGSFASCLPTLRQIAQREGRWPLVYKCNSLDALAMRRAGWSVLHVADDAMLTPATFTVDTPARRTLRRKLRAAKKAGIRIEQPDRLPFHDLAAIDAEWCARNGPARGGTMGRYCPEYVQSQWVAVAYQGDRIVAFVTFFATDREWALDLMRQTSDAPDGTMHALVTAAIEAARMAGIAQVSLAATPACPDPTKAIWRGIAKAVVARAGGPGLRQFKSAFAPQWVPRYAAAPGPLRLAIGLADVAREVHEPMALPAISSNAIHDLDENNELDSRKRA